LTLGDETIDVLASAVRAGDPMRVAMAKGAIANGASVSATERLFLQRLVDLLACPHHGVGQFAELFGFGGLENGIQTRQRAAQFFLQRFQLVASDPMLTDSRKSEEFQKLMSKLGGIPENQLTPLDRQLLNQLRTDGAKTARAEEKRGGDDGTVQNTGGNDPGKGDSNGKVGAPATIPEMNARALSAMHEQFPANEQQRLEKYYGKK